MTETTPPPTPEDAPAPTDGPLAHDIPLARRTAPGAAPGTLVSDPAAPRPRIRVIAYDAGGCTEDEDDAVDVESLPGRVRPGTVTWIDVVGLGDAAVIQRLGELFNLHRLALEDVIHVHQRPKVEDYGDRLFVVFRMVDPSAEEASEQVALFLGKELVITFQERPGDAFEPVRNRLRQGRGVIRNHGADYLTYALLDASIDQMFPALETYDDTLDTLTEDVLRTPDPEIAHHLHVVKRELLNLRRIVWASREMINNLMRGDFTLIRVETRTYLRDCYDHCIQLMDMLEMQREVTASLFDIHLSSLSNRLNEIMKVLTMIATIFIPLGFIAGIYGMNFDPEASPWNMPELDWYFGYPFALSVMAVTAVGLLLWFRRKGWIGRPRWRRIAATHVRRLRRGPRPAP